MNYKKKIIIFFLFYPLLVNAMQENNTSYFLNKNKYDKILKNSTNYSKKKNKIILDTCINLINHYKNNINDTGIELKGRNIPKKLSFMSPLRIIRDKNTCIIILFEREVSSILGPILYIISFDSENDKWKMIWYNLTRGEIKNNIYKKILGYSN